MNSILMHIIYTLHMFTQTPDSTHYNFMGFSPIYLRKIKQTKKQKQIYSKNTQTNTGWHWAAIKSSFLFIPVLTLGSHCKAGLFASHRVIQIVFSFNSRVLTSGLDVLFRFSPGLQSKAWYKMLIYQLCSVCPVFPLGCLWQWALTWSGSKALQGFC